MKTQTMVPQAKKTSKNSRKSVPASLGKLTQADVLHYVGGPIESYQLSGIPGINEPLRLVADLKDVQIFCDDAGQYILDRAVSDNSTARNKASNTHGQYAVARQRQIVSKEFALEVLLASAIPQEFQDLVVSLLAGKTSRARQCPPAIPTERIEPSQPVPDFSSVIELESAVAQSNGLASLLLQRIECCHSYDEKSPVVQHTIVGIQNLVLNSEDRLKAAFEGVGECVKQLLSLVSRPA